MNPKHYDTCNRRIFICPKCLWDECDTKWQNGYSIIDDKFLEKEHLYCKCKRCKYHFKEDVENGE